MGCIQSLVAQRYTSGRLQEGRGSRRADPCARHHDHRAQTVTGGPLGGDLIRVPCWSRRSGVTHDMRTFGSHVVSGVPPGSYPICNGKLVTSLWDVLVVSKPCQKNLWVTSHKRHTMYRCLMLHAQRSRLDRDMPLSTLASATEQARPHQSSGGLGRAGRLVCPRVWHVRELHPCSP